jgi:hypothetical protein
MSEDYRQNTQSIRNKQNRDIPIERNDENINKAIYIKNMTKSAL